MPTKAEVTPRLFPLTDNPYILEGGEQHYLPYLYYRSRSQ